MQELDQFPSATTEDLVPIKHSHPLVLLMDMEPKVAEILIASGYNVSVGTFGTSYPVGRQHTFHALFTNEDFPFNYAESEIVIVDVAHKPASSTLPTEKDFRSDAVGWITVPNTSEIDPRLVPMFRTRDDFDRILSHGGTFVIFADRPVSQILGEINGYNKRELNSWGFLSILNYLVITPDSGQDIRVAKDNKISAILEKHSKDAAFTCIMAPYQNQTAFTWLPLATNKYGRDIAGVIIPTEKKGCIFVFPRLANTAEFLGQFLQYVLPDIIPELFPDVEAASWVHRPEYELFTVTQINREILEIEEESKRKISILKDAIEHERNESGYLHDLLTGTGDKLVVATQKALESIGFQSVVNMDKEQAILGSNAPKREDLQIRDNSPLILAEVKGIKGMPSEEESLQVAKYIAPRMKELKRTDIRGLTIINHEKHKTGLDREPNLFQADVATTAQAQDIGLMTSWDLFRLVRSFLKNSWAHEQIQPLFYQNGRIYPVPVHYEYVGIIEGFLEKARAIGVRINAAELRLGDRIAFELPVEFEEQKIESLQLDGTPINSASAGKIVGILTKLTKDQARKGVRVFRVKRD